MHERRLCVMMLTVAFLIGLMLYNPYGCVDVLSTAVCLKECTGKNCE